jgi:hypothetical protein
VRRRPTCDLSRQVKGGGRHLMSRVDRELFIRLRRVREPGLPEVGTNPQERLQERREILERPLRLFRAASCAIGRAVARCTYRARGGEVRFWIDNLTLPFPSLNETRDHKAARFVARLLARVTVRFIARALVAGQRLENRCPDLGPDESRSDPHELVDMAAAGRTNVDGAGRTRPALELVQGVDVEHESATLADRNDGPERSDMVSDRTG